LLDVGFTYIYVDIRSPYIKHVDIGFLQVLAKV
jgi:hypothetical protein